MLLKNKNKGIIDLERMCGLGEVMSEDSKVLNIKLHRVSVREIIDFIMRSGDITSVSLSDKRMSDGTKAHQKFQNRQDSDYMAEVSINHSFNRDDMRYMVTGRIDGVIHSFEGSGVPLIDEIKSTSRDLNLIKGENEMHWAQAKMYAYMFLLREGYNKATCRLTYIELDTFTIKQYTKDYTIKELENYFDHIIDIYAEFAKMIDLFENEMLTSAKDMTFPFDGIRDGQSKLMKGVYRTIKDGEILFSRAPTGIGKTIATLFPSIKALGESETDKIFYLTAKTIGKEVAVNTVNKLVDNGLRIKYVVITAKDKICLHTETNCNPDVCPYAKGHYDRVNAAISEMYKEEDGYTRDIITKYSIIHRLCPYELSLDLALFSQIIVCDYNYAFDPSAMLRRFFMEGSGKYTLLVDEAHNLVDRARGMYSAQLLKSQTMELKKLVKELDPRLFGYFDKLNKVFIDMRKEMKEADSLEEVTKEAPLELETYVRGIIYRTEKIFKIHQNWEHMELLVDFYFLAYDFIKKYEIYGDNYVTYYQRSGQDLIVKLFCIDPRPNLREILMDMQGVIYFSATLLPMNYYKHLLGGTDDSYGLNLPSPFEPEKLNLMVDSSISTKYVDRKASIDELALRMLSFVEMMQGNYLIYFPSYKYMEQGIDAFKELVGDKNIEILVQQRNLSEVDKEKFIDSFSHSDEDKTLVAFAVLGGMFGEGIDLVGEKLSGAIIVGVGLPLICFEQNMIKDYFEEIMGEGFDYAYTYPGMNKVMQASGRVIRTTEDVGSVLLIDRRFNTGRYTKLFPPEWFHFSTIRSNMEMVQSLEHFWEDWNKYN